MSPAYINDCMLSEQRLPNHHLLELRVSASEVLAGAGIQRQPKMHPIQFPRHISSNVPFSRAISGATLQVYSPSCEAKDSPRKPSSLQLPTAHGSIAGDIPTSRSPPARPSPGWCRVRYYPSAESSAERSGIWTDALTSRARETLRGWRMTRWRQ